MRHTHDDRPCIEQVPYGGSAVTRDRSVELRCEFGSLGIRQSEDALNLGHQGAELLILLWHVGRQGGDMPVHVG